MHTNSPPQWSIVKRLESVYATTHEINVLSAPRGTTPGTPLPSTFAIFPHTTHQPTPVVNAAFSSLLHSSLIIALAFAYARSHAPENLVYDRLHRVCHLVAVGSMGVWTGTLGCRGGGEGDGVDWYSWDCYRTCICILVCVVLEDGNEDVPVVCRFHC